MQQIKKTTTAFKYYLLYLFLSLFLISQYFSLQHSVQHLFHAASEECLIFECSASPIIVPEALNFNFNPVLIITAQQSAFYFFYLTFFGVFSSRAPPNFIY